MSTPPFVMPGSKDPANIEDYTVDWNLWLAQVTDTVASAVLSGITGSDEVTPALLVQASSPHNTVTTTATTATVWLQGGTAGVDYTVGLTMTTAGGRVDRRTFIVLVR